MNAPAFDWVCLLDRAALTVVLSALSGRRFVGVVDCGDAVELVFEEGPPRTRNLVTIYTVGPHAGRVGLGSVADPESYLALNGELPYEIEPS